MRLPLLVAATDEEGGGNTTAPAELYESWLAEYRSARADGRLVTYTMHPEVIGRVHRFAQLEALINKLVSDDGVGFARMDEVADHVRPALMESTTA